MKYKHETILTGPQKSFVTLDEIGKVIDCTFHVHPEYELIYIASSFGTRFIGDNIENFNPGNLALIGPMVPHHYYNDPADSLSDSWGHARVIQFRENFAGQELFNVPEMETVKKMFEASKHGIDFNAETAAKVKPLIAQIFASTGPSRLIGLLELLSLMAASPYRKLSSVSGDNAAGNDDDHRMNRILLYIHDSLAHDKSPTLNETALKANMNPQAFSRYFRKTTFKCFIDYVNEVKVGKACRQLIDTDKTVAEICFDSGFNNLSNFNRQFQKFKKMTPKQFRNSFNP